MVDHIQGSRQGVARGDLGADRGTLWQPAGVAEVVVVSLIFHSGDCKGAFPLWQCSPSAYFCVSQSSGEAQRWAADDSVAPFLQRVWAQ